MCRFQTAGPWGLTARFNPLKPPPKDPAREPDLGGLAEADLEEICRKYSYIEPLGQVVTEARVRKRVEELRAEGVKISEKTLWNYLGQYRRGKLIGLHRKTRSDKGHSRYLSDEMLEIIKNLRKSGVYKTAEAVYKRACQIADARGEFEPTLNKVVKIVSGIPKPIINVVDDIKGRHRNRTRVTGRIVISKRSMVLQLDTTQVNVMTIDGRPLRGTNRKKWVKSKKAKVRSVRMYLTDAVDKNSGYIFPPKLTYDRPDRFTIAAYIREIILEFGLPHEIWVDRGKEYIAKHVQRAAAEINLRIRMLRPKSPQLKGVKERCFGTLDSRLWKTLPGYVGRNPQERPEHISVELTADDLLAKHLEFNEKYNNEPRKNGLTPKEYLQKYYTTLPVGPADLDIFLLKTETTIVQKQGIPYKGNYYWHPSYYKLIKQKVSIRVDPYDKHPPEITVYHRGKRFGLARLEPASQLELRAEQQAQAADINQAISAAQQQTADLEALVPDPGQQIPSKVKKDKAQSTNKKTTVKKPHKSRKNDPWDVMPT